MQSFITMLFCLVLILIAYNDFRYRALPVYLLAIAVVLAVLFSINKNVFSSALKYSVTNILLLALQLGLTSLYFSARNRKFTNIFKSYLGIGDLIFFLVLIFCFSPLNFILFIIISGFLTILFYTGRKSKVLIPLAGSQSIILCTILLSTLISGIIQPYNDFFLADIFFN
jgi:hypothetical protein